MRESTLPGRPPRRPLPKARATVALALAFIGAGPIASADALCPNQGTPPSELTVQTARDAVLCLLNEQRTASGLAPLTVNLSLQAAAQHHSKAMNKRNFFSHGVPMRRIKAAGYLGGVSSWRIGEVLHWGSGGAGSPQAAVSAWMASSSHRSTMLAGFADVGIGVVMGKPTGRGGRGAAIYTADFGFRR